MRVLTRYVLFEFLKTFAITLGGTTLLVMVVVVGFEARQQGIGLAQILQIVPYILPEALRYAVPGTTLFAACSVYGRLSAGNEVVAIKAQGISPMVVMWPVLILGALLSFGSVWLNDVAVTWGRAGVQRVVIESVEQIVYSMLRTQRSYATHNIAMNVRRVDGHRLIQPTLTVDEGDGKPSITVIADEAELVSEPAEGLLVIRFHNAEIDVDGGSGRIIHPGTYEHRVRLSDWTRKGNKSSGPSSCPMTLIPRRIREQQEVISHLEEQTAALAAFEMMTGDFEATTADHWQRRQLSISVAKTQLHRLRTEPFRRWANGTSCFFFVLVGAPMAIRRRKGEFLTSFALCFLPILLIYYPFLIGAVKQAKTGAWPPETVWLGNTILAIWGAWLMWKVYRY